MGAGHSHGAAHPGTAPHAHRRRLAIALGLSSVVLVAQAIGAVVTGSLALLTDTAHMLTDVIGLAVALVAAVLVTRPPDPMRTWGFRRIEVLAALGQATLLLVVGVLAAIEGVSRLVEPPAMPAGGLLVFGVIGLVANVIALVVLHGGRDGNLNLRAAVLEVMNDALGSVAVIVAAIVIQLTGFLQADAIAGLLIAALIVPRAALLIRDTGRILMEFTPAGLDLEEVRRHLLDCEHVLEVHDLHASTVGTGLPILTAHVVVEDGCFTDGHAAELLTELSACVAEHFPVAIHHSTFQLETRSIRAVAAHAAAHH